MTGPIVQPNPNQQRIAAHFDKAAKSYLQAADLQQQVALELARLLPTKLDVLLDLGCGPGWLHPQLAGHCQQLWAADLSPAMLSQAAKLAIASRYLQADAAALPLADESVQLVFSSLMLQWCPEPERVFAEIFRVLQPGGQLLLTTLVAGSLTEFNQSWARVDQQPHQLPFQPAEVLQQAARQSGLQFQSSQHCYQLYFQDVQSLARSFQQIGANYVAGRAEQGLGGKRRWLSFAAAYEQFRQPQGLPLSYQVLQMQAYKPKGGATG